MSALTTSNAQSLNFGFNIKWSTSEWPKTKDKLKKGNLVRENRKTKNCQESGKWQMKNQRKTQHFT
jgi:hypothetical protein